METCQMAHVVHSVTIVWQQHMYTVYNIYHCMLCTLDTTIS